MTTKQIHIPPLDLQATTFVLIGDTPLISHRFSEKAKREMLDKQQRKAKQGREIRDPEAEFLSSLYEITPGAYGFPAMAFKNAAVRAAKSVPDIAMTDARGFFHLLCDSHMLLPLRYSELRNTEDIVRLGGRSSEPRPRGYFYDWEIDITAQFNASTISPEQIIMLFDIAGFSVGVGDWRPEKDGMYGRFHVKKEDG